MGQPNNCNADLQFRLAHSTDEQISDAESRGVPWTALDDRAHVPAGIDACVWRCARVESGTSHGDVEHSAH